jgi:hypothetical protein
MAHQMMAVSREMQECIDECLHCHATCRNDEMMKACAQACRRCSEVCQGMAA